MCYICPGLQMCGRKTLIFEIRRLQKWTINIIYEILINIKVFFYVVCFPPLFKCKHYLCSSESLEIKLVPWPNGKRDPCKGYNFPLEMCQVFRMTIRIRFLGTFQYTWNLLERNARAIYKKNKKKLFQCQSSVSSSFQVIPRQKAKLIPDGETGSLIQWAPVSASLRARYLYAPHPDSQPHNLRFH